MMQWELLNHGDHGGVNRKANPQPFTFALLAREVLPPFARTFTRRPRFGCPEWGGRLSRLNLPAN